jgi:hypothetical protein
VIWLLYIISVVYVRVVSNNIFCNIPIIWSCSRHRRKISERIAEVGFSEKIHFYALFLFELEVIFRWYSSSSFMSSCS